MVGPLLAIYHPLVSAPDCDNQSQAYDWTASPSQPWPQTLAQTSTQSSSTTAASRLWHTNNWGLNVSTQTSVLSLLTPTHRLFSPAPLCFGMPPHRLLHTALLTKMPPHNSPFPSSFNGASSLKNYRVARILFSIQRTSAAYTVSAVTVATESPTRVSQAQHDVPPPPCLSRPADQPGHTPPPGLEEQNLRCIVHRVSSKAAPSRQPQAQGLSSFSEGIQNTSQLPTHSSPMPVPPTWDNIPPSPAPPTKDASTALAGIQTAIGDAAPCWSRTIPETHAHYHTCGTFWTTQTTWTWHSPQRRQ